MIRPTDGGLEIAQDRVDSMEARHVGTFALLADDLGFVLAADLGHRRETGQAIRNDCRRGRQVLFSPVLDFRVTEGLDGGKDHLQRMPRRVGLDGGDEGNLVLRPAPGLAATKLAAQIDIIDLNASVQLSQCFSLRHHLQQLVLEPPCGTVADADLALQFQGRNVILGLRQEVHRLEPRP